ncbi:MAG: hypothetical protein J7513_15520 [Solirubrobacteraceae bacterium]|nr:hypothetical protein [Solirubrobacteraceae bacterium]
MAPLVDAIIAAFPTASGLAQSDVLDALIRHAPSQARDDEIRSIADGPDDSLAERAAREVARWGRWA